jgi:hypothetical protein
MKRLLSDLLFLAVIPAGLVFFAAAATAEHFHIMSRLWLVMPLSTLCVLSGQLVIKRIVVGLTPA